MIRDVRFFARRPNGARIKTLSNDYIGRVRKLGDIVPTRRYCGSAKLNRAGSTGETLASAKIPEAGGRRVPGLLGSLVSLVNADRATRLHEHVHKLHGELGAIYRDRVGPVDAIFLNSPDDFQKIFRLEGRTPKHFLPEAWMLYNEIRQCSRGLLFMYVRFILSLMIL